MSADNNRKRCCNSQFVTVKHPRCICLLFIRASAAEERSKTLSALTTADAVGDQNRTEQLSTRHDVVWLVVVYRVISSV